jgi:YHS domain-containing protein
MRVIVMLLLAVVGLALMRGIVRDIGRAVSRAMGGSNKRTTTTTSQSAEGASTGSVGNLVKDPHSGTYIDPAAAVTADIDGTTYYFESKQTRDEYQRARG